MAKEEQFQQTKSLDNFTTEKVNVITNCLFGDYVDGVYVISDEIKKELLEDRKVKKSVFKNSVFCSAYIVGYGDVVFEATFQKNTVKNVAKAELFVLENEYRVNGYIQNTIRTKIAEFISELENFIENAYEYFHIVITENGVKEYNLKEDISLNAYISAKKNFNLNMDKLTAKDYNKIYKKYVTSRLEKLKKINNGFSRQVLDKFNGEFAKIEKYFLRDNNYKAVSELLDKCIEDCVGVNPKLKKDEQEVFGELTPLVDELAREATVIAEAAHDKAMSHLDKKERTKVDEISAQVEAGRYEGQQKPPRINNPVVETSSVETPTTSGSGRTSASAGRQPTKPPVASQGERVENIITGRIPMGSNDGYRDMPLNTLGDVGKTFGPNLEDKSQFDKFSSHKDSNNLNKENIEKFDPNRKGGGVSKNKEGYDPVNALKTSTTGRSVGHDVYKGNNKDKIDDQVMGG